MVENERDVATNGHWWEQLESRAIVVQLLCEAGQFDGKSGPYIAGGCDIIDRYVAAASLVNDVVATADHLELNIKFVETMLNLHVWWGGQARACEVDRDFSLELQLNVQGLQQNINSGGGFPINGNNRLRVEWRTLCAWVCIAIDIQSEVPFFRIRRNPRPDVFIGKIAAHNMFCPNKKWGKEEG